MTKAVCTLIAIMVTFGAGYTQTPFDSFAPEGKKKEMLKLPETTFRTYNTDTASKIKYIELDSKKLTLMCYDKNGMLLDSIQFRPTDSKFLSIDPKADKPKNVATSPYAYAGGNPINRIDPDGRDWIVSVSQVNGQTQIKLTFAGAIMNSSGKEIDMQKLMDSQVKQFKSVFGQGNVTANLMLREIKSADDLKDHESLIDIQAGSNFRKTESGGTVGGDSHYGGKYIRLNADGINEDGSFTDNKTAIHEIGHTGGLMHPWEFGNKPKGNFVNGKPFSEGVQVYYNSANNLNLDANFMGYSSWSAQQPSIDPGLSNAEKIYYFNKIVGKATQGQIQQIINNLYDGNLNSNADIPY